MDNEVDYESWAKDMCFLLDMVALELSAGEHEKAEDLLETRFDLARKQGLIVTYHAEVDIGNA